MLGHHSHIIALAPFLQLLHGGGAKSIASRQHYRLALTLEFFRQLANGGGFAGTIYAHHEDHVRMGVAVYLQWC